MIFDLVHDAGRGRAVGLLALANLFRGQGVCRMREFHKESEG